MKKDVKELLRAIEMDANNSAAGNDNVHQIISRIYSQQEKISESFSSNLKARNLIYNNQELLNSLKDRERLEGRIFRATSNTALISTIGAAVAASVLPAAVIPTAIVASVAAIGGYVSKLMFDQDAKEGAKKILDQAASDPTSGERG